VYNESILRAIDRLTAGSHTSRDLALLISHFSVSGDVSALRTLLNTDARGLLTDAVYILSEIGSAGAPLLDCAFAHGTHPDEQIRYWALNSIMTCANREKAETFIHEAGLENDPAENIRTKVARYLGGSRRHLGPKTSGF
jgi:hypothetical protein